VPVDVGHRQQGGQGQGAEEADTAAAAPQAFVVGVRVGERQLSEHDLVLPSLERVAGSLADDENQDDDDQSRRHLPGPSSAAADHVHHGRDRAGDEEGRHHRQDAIRTGLGRLEVSQTLRPGQALDDPQPRPLAKISPTHDHHREGHDSQPE